MKNYYLVLPLILAGCAEGAYESQPTTLISQAEMMVGEPTVAPAAVPVVDTRKPLARNLLDYTPVEIYGWLGAPSLVRRDSRVQVAQFSNSICVLDVYFYSPSEQMDFLANHIDARTVNGADYSDDECLISFFDGNDYPEELLFIDTTDADQEAMGGEN